jgi:hypothetical protein
VSIKLLSLEQMMWHGYCLISRRKLLKAVMADFGTYPCLLVLHPVLEAIVPSCCHHFESYYWDQLSHVTPLFLSLSFVVYNQDLLGHGSLLPALWIPWLHCLCFSFFVLCKSALAHILKVCANSVCMFKLLFVGYYFGIWILYQTAYVVCTHVLNLNKYIYIILQWIFAL